ncbi:MAG: Holliday junction branch migration DNA helicase RuvB [Bdellovibrionaceae bacterium]|nr:Holliday junction branch migration DNA helicase RuvB [Pseudobdellovibrionaceae bacterium]|tara:strand:+ start:2021 stop:3046 length:1026 start_codon:yes stop_codon:yes gene_type:complete
MDTSERILSPTEKQGEDFQEKSLRPSRLKEYVGQVKIKERLSLFIEAAQNRRESLDHVLLAGPPGLGKTTLAHIISQEMGTQTHTITGPNVEKKGDLAAILTNLHPGDVLFIDEIHRLPKTIEEVLYGAMEDFKLDIIIGQGPSARTIQIDLPYFTLVGATTRSGLLSNPLRDRFGVQFRLDFYPLSELEKIVMRSAHLLSISLSETGATEIARRSRGTPRIANRLLKRVRDFYEVRFPHESKITAEIAGDALGLFEVDSAGLDQMDRKYLLTILEKFSGGPVGIETLCAALGEERDTIEDVFEPYLIQEGFIQRTPRGRTVTPRTYLHLGKDPAAPEIIL